MRGEPPRTNGTGAAEVTESVGADKRPHGIHRTRTLRRHRGPLHEVTGTTGSLAVMRSSGSRFVGHHGPMTIQLIGAGLGRTGTLSLKVALERLLGGCCHHMLEVVGHPDEIPAWDAAMRGGQVDFPALLSDYTAIVDYPGAAVWRDLADAFPDAPVLLSTRASATEWWESASSTILARGVPVRPGLDNWRPMVDAVLTKSLGDIDWSTDEAGVKAAYERHNAAVRATIHPDRLVEYQPGDGWAPLCAALNTAEPDEPFPHTNTRQQFRARAGMDDT